MQSRADAIEHLFAIDVRSLLTHAQDDVCEARFDVGD